MADDIVDLLQIKIEKAKAQLPDETLNAINMVDWKGFIIGLREKKGYSFEQLGDLELETELVLYGLLAPADYPKELEKRLKIPRPQIDVLINEMNQYVFAKIREELIKSTERKKVFAKKETEEKSNAQVFKKAGIEVIATASATAVPPKTIETKPLEDTHVEPATQQLQEEKLELKGEVVHPILAQKLSGPVQMETVKTEHTLENITKTVPPPSSDAKPKIPKADPYREIPE